MTAKDTAKDTAKSDVARAEEANAEVQERFDEAAAKGYIGETSDPLPNSAHSLASGPDAPPLAPDDRTRFEQPAAAAPVKEA